jgi:carbon monoxide dehydrogenase subunit G
MPEEERMTPRLALRDHGRTFATRGRASELREAFTAELEGCQFALIDFTGVTNITYSFADELVGKLAALGATQVESINMTPGIADTVQRAVARRGASATVG